ncbi:hypothetical protein A45J_0434 [hot springs metagenome]
MKWLVVVITISTLILGCSPKKADKPLEKVPQRVISRDEAVGSLPCFKCHSYQKFSTPLQMGGVFPHQKHMDAGYHCNQCHD